jgi:hypothetical protein
MQYSPGLKIYSPGEHFPTISWSPVDVAVLEIKLFCIDRLPSNLWKHDCKKVIA